MRKLFAIIFAWALFSTQAFAQFSKENEKISQLQKIVASHLTGLDGVDIEEVQAFFAGKWQVSQEELKEAINNIENMRLKDAKELAALFDIEILSQISEKEWEQRKYEFLATTNKEFSKVEDENGEYSWGRFFKDLVVATFASVLGVSAVFIVSSFIMGFFELMMFLTLVFFFCLIGTLFFGFKFNKDDTQKNPLIMDTRSNENSHPLLLH